MLPVISIVGRPNVGKSTLFNRLTKSRDALVNDRPGVTRDRLYGLANVQGRNFLVVDTGGLGDDSSFAELINAQVEAVLVESDALLFLLDATEGLTAADYEIAQKLNRTNVPISIVVNKCEGLVPELVTAEFHSLGFGEPVPISAQRGLGLTEMLTPVLRLLSYAEDPLWLDPGPKIAVIGKPNVGKSTLINALCQSERLIVSDEPGTTRDAISVPVQIGEARFRFLDTAGVRRRARVNESLEKLSVVKTLQAIEAAHVVILMIDGTAPIADQDATLAGLVLRAGRPVVLAVNKIDRINSAQRRDITVTLRRKLAFAAHHEALFVSGLQRQGFKKLLQAIGKAYRSAMIEMPTAVLNRLLQEAIIQTPPPMSGGRSVKLKYAHQGGRNPPVVVVHGNNVKGIAEHYRRYLENYFREKFNLFGSDVRVVFRSGRNPYESNR